MSISRIAALVLCAAGAIALFAFNSQTPNEANAKDEAAKVAPVKAAPASKKVIYYTHEPGTYHKYTPQMAVFKELAAEAGWDVTYMTGEHKAQIERLRTKDFAKGYDAVVYNFCFAGAQDLEAAHNVMVQTREHGVPALLIHCTMHSWWDTYKRGKAGAIGPDYKGKAKAKDALVAKWRENHSNETFPAWGDFTGVASGSHGPKKPVVCTKCEGQEDHPATARMPDGFTTGNTELYNNIYVLDTVVPLVDGTQDKAKAIIMWTCPQGKSEVMGLTLGHDLNDWNAKPFQHLIIDGLNYLMRDQED